MKKKMILILSIVLLVTSTACILTSFMEPKATPEPDTEVSGLLETLAVLQTKEAEGSNNDEEDQEQEEVVQEQPTEQPTETPTEIPEPDICFENVSLNFDQQIASAMWGEIVPEYVPEYEGIERHTPDYIKFNFTDYVIQGHFHEPFIAIYPVAQLIEFDEFTEWHVNTLQTLIASQPETPEDFPFIPIWNAASLFHSNVEYVDFQNGSGIRYLTEFGQAYWPVHNDNMFYTFQGITSDGQYYISAVLPVHHPNVYQSGEEVPSDWEPYYDEAAWDAYINPTVAMLNGQPGNSFTPYLDLLDEMIGSITFQPCP